MPSPEYNAVKVCVPAVSGVVVVSEAVLTPVPGIRVPVPSAGVPSSNVMVPVASGVPETVTFAVSVSLPVGE